MNKGVIFKASALSLVVAAAFAFTSRSLGAEKKENGKMETITGEVVDLMCYLDHGAKGEKHKGCAEKCIKGGGPVGLLSGDQVYLLIGDHETINDKLASKAAETVTVKGKVVERSGMKMIENAELQK
jgi:hypothetical protein